MIIDVSNLPVHPIINKSTIPAESVEVVPYESNQNFAELPGRDCAEINDEQGDEDDHLAFAPPPLPGANRKKLKSKKGKLDLYQFENFQPQCVEMMPWDVHGNGIYLISCTEEFWHDRQQDGHHWQFTMSLKKGLDGIRKFGTCVGSNICMNPKCALFTSEGI